MVSIFIEKREDWVSKAPPLFSFHDETFLPLRQFLSKKIMKYFATLSKF